MVESGVFSPGEPHRFAMLTDRLRRSDDYMVVADFELLLAGSARGRCAMAQSRRLGQGLHPQYRRHGMVFRRSRDQSICAVGLARPLLTSG